ncbi:hypothetical protein [Marmoricola sp. URHB0036]|uniref:hypothetical protein n=1 Tax=Marmoricola sp. URHB0036 TaxID=1298863 RepID=UPI00040C025A|nr:hypothetical protein [Marmoricola sp. URHB0036]
MSADQNPIEHDDPRLEVLQAVYDRINSWEESATPERIRSELDEAIAQADIDVDDSTRKALASHIEQGGGREDVADVLGSGPS